MMRSRLLSIRSGAAGFTLLLLGSCGHPAGTPCEIQGSGFTSSHDCAHQCLSRWQIACPDGSRVTPNTCSGAFDCSPGSCPDGQVCYADDDPFEARTYCVMADTCGNLNDETRGTWERESLEHQRTLVNEYNAKRKRRLEAKKGGEPWITSDAEPLQTDP
ncbi:MAG: hypothetical protein R3E82_03930 [Pseudomonadales bacterium]